MSIKWFGDTSFNNPKEKLVASYTYNLNRTCQASSIDYPTSTITSVGHPFANGNQVYLLPKFDVGDVFPSMYLPTGIVLGTLYYIRNATANTFQLSTSSGGAIITLAQGGSTNISKWYFESSDNGGFNLVNLPPKFRYKVRFYGRSIDNSCYLFFQPNGYPYSSVLMTGSDSYNNNPGNSGGGNMFMYREYDIDSRYYMNYKVKGFDVGATSSTTSLSTRVIDYHTFCNNMSYYGKPITNIEFSQFEVANGTIVEVYEIG